MRLFSQLIIVISDTLKALTRFARWIWQGLILNLKKCGDSAKAFVNAAAKLASRSRVKIANIIDKISSLIDKQRTAVAAYSVDLIPKRLRVIAIRIAIIFAIIITIIIVVLLTLIAVVELVINVYEYGREYFTLEELSQFANVGSLFPNALGFVAAIVAISIAISAFLTSRENLKVAQKSLAHTRTASAWQILSNKAPGNSGKKEAIETLLSDNHDLDDIDLSSDTHGGKVYLVDLQAANARLVNANLEGANLKDAKLQGANLARADLKGANLARADLKGANLQGANLQDANLRDAKLQGANLLDANLQGANLVEANLQGANLLDANLQGAHLWNANLKDANLMSANLINADLIGAKLQGSDLSGANFNRAQNLSRAHWDSIDAEDEEIHSAFASENDPPKKLPPEILEKIELLPYNEYNARRKKSDMQQ